MKQLFYFTGIMLLLLTPKSHIAQQIDTTWLRQYDRIHTNALTNISKIHAEKYIVQHGSHYYFINSYGDSLSSGSIDPPHMVNAIWAQDTLIFMGSIVNNSPTLSRLDTNANIIWSVELVNAGFAQGVYGFMVSGQYIFASGSYESSKPFVAKLDFDGNIIWFKEYPQTTFACLTNLISLSDGNFLATGYLDDYPLAIKMDVDGDPIWSYDEPIFISFYKAPAVEKSNQEIIIACRNKIIVLDANGTRVDSVHVPHDFFQILKANDTLYFVGSHKETTNANEKYPYVEVRNEGLDSLNGFIYNSERVHALADNRFTDAVFTGNGGFITAGAFRDTVDVTANTYNILCAKFNEPIINLISDIHSSTFSIHAYPNPAENWMQITIHHVGGIGKIDRIEIIDMLGRQMGVEKISSDKLQINHLHPGIYSLVIYIQGERQVIRFSKL